MRLYFNSLSLGVQELIKFIYKNLGRGWIARNIPQDPHWKLGPALSYNQPLLFGPNVSKELVIETKGLVSVA